MIVGEALTHEEIWRSSSKDGEERERHCERKHGGGRRKKRKISTT